MVSARDREGHTRGPCRQGACACHRLLTMPACVVSLCPCLLPVPVLQPHQDEQEGRPQAEGGAAAGNAGAAWCGRRAACQGQVSSSTPLPLLVPQTGRQQAGRQAWPTAAGLTVGRRVALCCAALGAVSCAVPASFKCVPCRFTGKLLFVFGVTQGKA